MTSTPLSIDGTGYFSSKEVHCDQCCEKRHRDGQITYYHLLLGAVLVNPGFREVFPLAPEPIFKQDGAKKNDCERKAAARLLTAIRREHPHMKLIVVEDGLASNAPHIRQLQALNYRFILGAKPNDHKLLFEWVETTADTRHSAYTDEQGITHRFRYLNGAPLNEANFELTINFLEYWETRPNGKCLHFSWVTDIPIQPDNLMQLMRGGRARWKIENETFTKRCCQLFQLALNKAGRKLYFWQKLRSCFQSFLLQPNTRGSSQRLPQARRAKTRPQFSER